MSLLRLIATESFPLDNIAFLLMLEVAKWYSLANTCMMTYRKETMMFFRVGLKLFHGSFVRFMSGSKSEGHILRGGRAKDLTPATSSINFAVQSIGFLRNYKPPGMLDVLPPEIQPGIIGTAIDLKPSSTESPVSYILSFDGQTNISPGFTELW